MRSERDPILWAAAALLLAVTAVGAAESLSWVGRPFPGFLVLENRVVASAGLARWPATQGGKIYQQEVLAFDGTPLRDTGELRAYVASLPPGTPVEYRLRRGDRESLRTIDTRVFDGVDYLLLFGAYLFCGLGLGGVALAIRYLRGSDRVATGSALGLGVVGLYALTAVDLYGPLHAFFRLHALAESFLFAGAVHMALVLPRPARWVEERPRWLWVPYGAAAVLALAVQAGLQDPAAYRLTHRIATSAFGAGLLLFIGSQLRLYFGTGSFQDRQRVKVVVLGTVAALTPQLVLVFLSATSGGEASENLLGWSGVFFPISIGYAVLRSDLLEVDTLLRRTVNYAFLTLAVALAYAGAVAGFEALFRDQGLGSGTFVVLFSFVSVVVLLPLRDRLQQGIDRVFFRSAYDFRRVLESTSARLASVTELDVIAHEITHAVDEALHPEWLRLLVRPDRGAPLQSIGARGAPPALPLEPLTAAAEVRDWPFDVETHVLAVPFRSEDRLVALLLLGRRLSGAPFGGDDRRLLHTLSNHGAVAIENALALEQLRELNRSLESKVEERTRELRDTQAQLVHREKMASIGQFVAGIAHEINNPLNFIEGNLFCLEEYVGELTGALDDYERCLPQDPALRARIDALRKERELDHITRDLEDVFHGCREGVERTSGLVRDLRTFSRLDQPERMPVDLHEALDSTLNLLRGRLTGIRVVRTYGDVPPVECLAGQINQVFMNLIANAADAMGEEGVLEVRTERRGEEAVVEIRDTGCGIPPEQCDRIFDPFFTTKDVGHGTGLGLSITYGVISRHGGRISVESRVGHGTRFRVELPIHAPPEEEIRGA